MAHNSGTRHIGCEGVQSEERQGIDFEEIFSPVVKMSSISVALGLAARLNLEIE